MQVWRAYKQKKLESSAFGPYCFENGCLQSLDWTTELSFMTFNSCLVGIYIQGLRNHSTSKCSPLKNQDLMATRDTKFRYLHKHFNTRVIIYRK